MLHTKAAAPWLRQCLWLFIGLALFFEGIFAVFSMHHYQLAHNKRLEELRLRVSIDLASHQIAGEIFPANPELENTQKYLGLLNSYLAAEAWPLLVKHIGFQSPGLQQSARANANSFEADKMLVLPAGGFIYYQVYALPWYFHLSVLPLVAALIFSLLYAYYLRRVNAVNPSLQSSLQPSLQEAGEIKAPIDGPDVPFSAEVPTRALAKLNPVVSPGAEALHQAEAPSRAVAPPRAGASNAGASESDVAPATTRVELPSGLILQIHLPSRRLVHLQSGNSAELANKPLCFYLALIQYCSDTPNVFLSQHKALPPELLELCERYFRRMNELGHAIRKRPDFNKNLEKTLSEIRASLDQVFIDDQDQKIAFYPKKAIGEGSRSKVHNFVPPLNKALIDIYGLE